MLELYGLYRISAKKYTLQGDFVGIVCFLLAKNDAEVYAWLRTNPQVPDLLSNDGGTIRIDSGYKELDQLVDCIPDCESVDCEGECNHSKTPQPRPYYYYEDFEKVAGTFKEIKIKFQGDLTNSICESEQYLRESGSVRYGWSFCASVVPSSYLLFECLGVPTVVANKDFPVEVINPEILTILYGE